MTSYWIIVIPQPEEYILNNLFIINLLMSHLALELKVT